MYTRYRKGFSLIEVVLSTALISGASVIKYNHQQEQELLSKASNFGSQLADIMMAIDKRMLIDTPVLMSGAWEKEWNTNNEVVMMLKEELIAYQNGICGLATGWVPQVDDPEVSKTALIPCFMWDGGNMPLKLKVNAARYSGGEGLASDNGDVLSEWVIRFSHDQSAYSEKYNRLLGEVVRSARISDIVRVKGAHDFRLYHLQTNETLTNKTCIDAKMNCGVEAKYTTIHKGVDNDTFLRLDSANSLLNEITFFANTTDGKAHCYQPASRLGGGDYTVRTSCGLKLVDDNGDVLVNADADTLGTSSFTIVDDARNSNSIMSSQDGGAVAQVLCTDETNVATPCGMTSVNEAGSLSAEAYLNSMELDELNFKRVLRQVSKTDSSVDLFKVDAKGFVTTRTFNLTPSGNGLSEQDLDKSSLKVTFSGDETFIVDHRGDTYAKTGVNISTNAYFDTNLSVSNNAVITGQAIVKKFVIDTVFSEGSSCENAGMISRKSDGEAMLCEDNLWKGLYTSHGSGAILPYASSAGCPDGWGQASDLAGYSLVSVGSNGSYNVSLGERFGDSYRKMTVATMPTHNHGYYDYVADNEKKKSGRGSDSDAIESKVYTNKRVSSSFGDATPFSVRDPSYGVVMCRKL